MSLVLIDPSLISRERENVIRLNFVMVWMRLVEDKPACFCHDTFSNQFVIQGMYIRVKRHKTTYFLQCVPSETILRIKEKLQELIDQPVNDQRLILDSNNQVLDDSKTLADQKVSIICNKLSYRTKTLKDWGIFELQLYLHLNDNLIILESNASKFFLFLFSGWKWCDCCPDPEKRFYTFLDLLSFFFVLSFLLVSKYFPVCLMKKCNEIKCHVNKVHSRY